MLGAQARAQSCGQKLFQREEEEIGGLTGRDRGGLGENASRDASSYIRILRHVSRRIKLPLSRPAFPPARRKVHPTRHMR
jgi:hypothetical protein